MDDSLVVPLGWYGLMLVSLVGVVRHLILLHHELRLNRYLHAHGASGDVCVVSELGVVGEVCRAGVKGFLWLLCVVRFVDTANALHPITPVDLFGQVEVACNLTLLTWWSWKAQRIRATVDPAC